MRDPFIVLGVADDADDAAIRRRYLALVREFPPDRAPERFQAIRAAYEALSDERRRLETTLLRPNTAALTRLYMNALRAGSIDGQSSGGAPSGGAPSGGAPSGGAPSGAPAPRATKQTMAALLAEGIAKAMPDLSHEGGGKHGGR